MPIPASRVRSRPFWLITALACIAIFCEAGHAQIQSSPNAGGFCWRGRPAPACRTFLLAEGNVFTPVAGSRYTRIDYNGGTRTQSLELTWYVAWELGGMLNLDANDAVGASVLVGGDANGARWGVKGRYRRWLDAATALDVGAGVLGAGRSVPRDGEPGNDHVPAVGLTGDVSLGFTEWASVGVRADVLFSEEGGGDPATAYYVGTRLGTRPALVASAAPLVFSAILFLVYVGSGGP
ncbi:MAG TPA: hypothetical protein VHG93_10250 [Longimicrobium sp.]|nr:hypothetical protein [Longimicrobium sp.]